jgi:excisionase family DNA binding protein
MTLTIPSQGMQDVLLVDPKEAARLLAISQRTLWKWTFEAQSALPYVRVGRLVRYSVGDLMRWIESRRQGGNVQ